MKSMEEAKEEVHSKLETMEEKEDGILNKGSSLIKEISKVTYNVIISGNLGM